MASLVLLSDLSTVFAVFVPGAPNTPAPGNVPAPVKNKPFIGVLYLLISGLLPISVDNGEAAYQGL